VVVLLIISPLVFFVFSLSSIVLTTSPPRPFPGVLFYKLYKKVQYPRFSDHAAPLLLPAFRRPSINMFTCLWSFVILRLFCFRISTAYRRATALSKPRRVTGFKRATTAGAKHTSRHHGRAANKNSDETPVFIVHYKNPWGPRRCKRKSSRRSTQHLEAVLVRRRTAYISKQPLSSSSVSTPTFLALMKTTKNI